MKYNRPEGCQAAVTTNWRGQAGFFVRTNTLEASIVCGARSAYVTDSFEEELLGINHAYNADQTRDRLGAKVSETLVAMCLGCPHNTARQTQAPEKA